MRKQSFILFYTFSMAIELTKIEHLQWYEHLLVSF